MRPQLLRGPTAHMGMPPVPAPRLGTHEAAAEEIQARPAEHLALQHFEAVDTPLDRTITPGQVTSALTPW
jgi:hypothetical protein